MNRYSANFTLADIFSNKELANHLPFVDYKEYNVVTREGSDVSVKTQMKTVKRQIFDTSIRMARFHYKPLHITKSGDTIIFDGNLITSIDACASDIYDNLVGFRPFLMFSANNGDIIRTALKENLKNARRYGIDCKLFLRAQSIMEIKGMSIGKLKSFMDDVMSNILFGDDFPETQRKYQVKKLDYGKMSYEEMRKAWREKVGI